MLSLAYNEILDFLAAGTTPESIARFRPSPEAQERVAELLAHKSEGELSRAENDELEEYLTLEHLMVMAKARARLRLQS